MVASCMADIPSDADDDDIGDDADLLDELSELGGGEDDEAETHVARQPSPAMRHCDDGGGTCAGEDLLSVIESRIAMYTTAEQVWGHSLMTSRKFGLFYPPLLSLFVLCSCFTKGLRPSHIHIFV